MTTMRSFCCGSIDSCRSETLGRRRFTISDGSRRRVLEKQRRRHHRDDCCVRVSAYGGAKVVDPLVQLERLFPDVPAPVLRLGKTEGTI